MIKSLIHSMIVCPDMDINYPKITHGKGVYIYDKNGKKYIDGSSGSAAKSNLGHGIEEIGDVVKKQISKIAALPTHSFNSEVTENYLDKLVAFSSMTDGRAWTVSSGTEAVENAIKLAYQYHHIKGKPNRHKVIARWGSYHGNSVFTLDVGGMKMRRQTYSRWMNNFPHISPAYSYRKPDHLTDEEFSFSLIEEFKECIQKEDPETIAAIIVEPVVAAALGAVPPPHDSYFKALKSICEYYDILLISDEILTGFGRIGSKFGMEKWGVQPDIIAAGKGISAGYYPLSGIIANKKVSDVFVLSKTPFLGGHTFACNPVGSAVGTWVIDYIEKHNVIQNADVMGQYFNSRLRELLDIDIVGDVRGIGMLQGIELVMDKKTKNPFPKELRLSKEIGQRSVDKGVVLYPGTGSVDGNLGDHIMICPPLISEKHHIDIIVDTLRESILEVKKEKL